MKDTRYYHADGSLKWGSPFNVEHLILQLQTLDPEMKVGAVDHIRHPFDSTKRARSFGLSMSRERWDKGGWLNFGLDAPLCLAIWASQAIFPLEHAPKNTPLLLWDETNESWSIGSWTQAAFDHDRRQLPSAFHNDQNGWRTSPQAWGARFTHYAELPVKRGADVSNSNPSV